MDVVCCVDVAWKKNKKKKKNVLFFKRGGEERTNEASLIYSRFEPVRAISSSVSIAKNEVEKRRRGGRRRGGGGEKREYISPDYEVLI